jgi:zinc protease
VEILKEIDNFAKAGPTDEEMNFMRSAVTQADALKYETSFQKLVFIERMMEYGLEPAFVQQQMDITKAMTKAEASATVKQLLSGPRAIVVVGDMATYRSKLEKLGYPVVEIDKAVLIDGK